VAGPVAEAAEPFNNKGGNSMKKVVIVGAQWGDEGKGKVVNYFAPDFQWVARFSGGANAGHTIYAGDKKIVNHLLPSISPEGESKAFLGAGMVIDLEQLIGEIDLLEKEVPGFSNRVHVDPEAFLVLPWHKTQDQIMEAWRNKPLGTTRKGVGPAYADKVSREGIKFYHLFDEAMLVDRLEQAYSIKKQQFGDKLQYNPEQMFNYLVSLRQHLEMLKVHFTGAIDLHNVFKGTSVLFEGAQGVLLDLDFGTYPFVTSGSCMAHGVSSVGFSTFELDDVIGVLKAYTTRVGEGPFPTFEDSEVTRQIQERGNEFGATTGRPRRVGWLDIPALRYAKIRSGLTRFILTKADVLNGLDSVKVCVGYEVDGVVKEVPSTSHDFFVARPVYETLEGWPSTEHLNFLKFMLFVEEKTGVNVSHISYGPRTEEMIEKNEWIQKCFEGS